MSLLAMSFYGGVIILTVLLLRAVLGRALPKRTFVILWSVALFRLLVPVQISSAFSVWSLTERLPESLQEKHSEESVVPSDGMPTEGTPAGDAGEAGSSAGGNTEAGDALGAFHGVSAFWRDRFADVFTMVSRMGTLVCSMGFLAAYIGCFLRFRTALPVDGGFVQLWMRRHRLRRSVAVRQSDRVATPLTYGIFRPVILLPVKLVREAEEEKLAYVLHHELVHIRRFDAAMKPVMAAALCLHWFNPLVWAMYAVMNRDMEMACDEKVLEELGAGARKGYALMLLETEERRDALLPLHSGFGRSAIEERIRAVMKMKKRTTGALVCSVALLAAVLVLFATSAEKEPEEPSASGEAGDQAIGIVPDGAGVPEAVLEQAKLYVAAQYERRKEADPGADFQNWRLDSLAHSYTYEEFYGMTLEVYLMNYTFLAGAPDQVILAGGSSIDGEGWVVPDYPNSHYLVFERNGGELTFLTDMFENDCFPGDETFTTDMRLLVVKDEPRFTASADVFSYRGITYGQFREQGGGEAELLHANFFSAPVPGKNLNIVFSGEYDEAAAGSVLTEEDRSVRLEGKLGEMLDWFPADCDVETFVRGLAWDEEELPAYRYAEGAGTAYYVADRYLIVEFDSDGDGERDAVLEISMDKSEQISDGSYAWLY